MTNIYIYNICYFKNCLIFSCSDISDKNIIKRFTIHRDLFQIKGFLRFLKSNPILIGSDVSYDSEILSIITNSYNEDSVEVDFDYIYNKPSNIIYKNIFDIKDLRKYMIKTKDSVQNYNLHIKNVNNISEKKFIHKDVGVNNILDANEYNLRMLLNTGLVFHGSFNINCVEKFLFDKKLKIKSNIPVESTISMF